MKTLLLAAAVVAVVPAIWGAEKREVSLTLHREGMSLDSLSHHLSMGTHVGFVPAASAKTAKGRERLRIRQLYGGLEVVGASANVEVTRDGEITGVISGSLAFNLHPDIPDPQACRRNLQDIKARVGRYLQEDQSIAMGPHIPWQNFQAEMKVDIQGEDSPARLVYEVDFFVELDTGPSRPSFQLDACHPDLRVITYYDMISSFAPKLGEERPQMKESTIQPQVAIINNTKSACPGSPPAHGLGGNLKSGKIIYGRNRPYCLEALHESGMCKLCSKDYACVIDDRKNRTVPFNCSVGYQDPVNGGYGVANDAFYHAYSAGEMYYKWYNTTALSYVPEVHVHTLGTNQSRCVDNAFWDKGKMLLGDGCVHFYPLVAQDVVGHELGHGVVQRYSGLLYKGQSGGIHEAFADIFGEVAEFYTRGSCDWKTGASFTKTMDALRYYDKPSRDTRGSIDSAKDYTRNMGVHLSSGVFRRAFYQLVTVQGYPMKKAFDVFVQANKVIWSVCTNFQEGACGVMQAAYDLGYDVMKVKEAFAKVDIDLTSCNYKAFGMSVVNGERREGVLVSSDRNPVFTLGEAAGATVTIEVLSDLNTEVTVSVTSDAAGSDVIASGPAPFVFKMTPETGFFKLSTSQDDDVTLDFTLNSTP